MVFNRLIIVTILELFSMYLDSVSTFQPTFVIDQLHFIPRTSVLESLYQCLSYFNEMYTAPSIARFIVRSHFGTMSACLIQLALPTD